MLFRDNSMVTQRCKRQQRTEGINKSGKEQGPRPWEEERSTNTEQAWAAAG